MTMTSPMKTRTKSSWYGSPGTLPVEFELDSEAVEEDKFIGPGGYVTRTAKLVFASEAPKGQQVQRVYAWPVSRF